MGTSAGMKTRIKRYGYNLSHKSILKASKTRTLKRITVIKQCVKCNKNFKVVRKINKQGSEVVSKKETKFCSRSCSNSHKHTEETKKKISNTLTKYEQCYCKVCGIEISRYTKYNKCKKCFRNDVKYRKSLSDAIQKVETKWMPRNHKSYAEKFFIKVLDKNGFKNKYKFNKHVVVNNKHYYLDFYFPDKKLDLEIDGKQHKYNDRIISDKIRNKNLIKNKYKVYRIEWKNINNIKGKKYMKNEINKLLYYLNRV